ncbi:MAG: hypothetical protein ACK2T7_07305 [Anaerolineales bacterium]
MKCDRCGEQIPLDEEIDYYSETLCEECYMRALSPSKACDPWAVRSAQRLSDLNDTYSSLTKIQKEILNVLAETGGAPAEIVAEKLNISMTKLTSEFATLRHMEKVRGQMRGKEKIICLWDEPGEETN